VHPAADLASIQGRMDVRHAVQEGRIVDAIELVNEINPEVRRPPPCLHVPTAAADLGVVLYPCSGAGYERATLLSSAAAAAD
jgi:hypothetical protein